MNINEKSIVAFSVILAVANVCFALYPYFLTSQKSANKCDFIIYETKVRHTGFYKNALEAEVVEKVGGALGLDCRTQSAL